MRAVEYNSFFLRFIPFKWTSELDEFTSFFAYMYQGKLNDKYYTHGGCAVVLSKNQLKRFLYNYVLAVLLGSTFTPYSLTF